MALFKPYKILSSALNSLPINEGQIIVTTDDQSLYIDAENNQRIKIGTTDLASKQETLISGTNIKTINNESILGSGNIAIKVWDGITVSGHLVKDLKLSGNNSGAIVDSTGNYTVLGTNTAGDEMRVGTPSLITNIRGSETRPRYNSSEQIALISDLPYNEITTFTHTGGYVLLADGKIKTANSYHRTYPIRVYENDVIDSNQACYSDTIAIAFAKTDDAEVWTSLATGKGDDLQDYQVTVPSDGYVIFSYNLNKGLTMSIKRSPYQAVESRIERAESRPIRESAMKNFGTQPAANGTPGSFCNVSTGNYNDLLTSVYEPLRTAYPNYITRENIGKDASNTYDMYVYTFEPRYYQQSIILIGGVHANEEDSIACLARIMYLIAHADGTDADLAYLRQNVKITVVPVLNVWGFSQNPKVRTNYNGTSLQTWNETTLIAELNNLKPILLREKAEASFLLDMHTTTNNTYKDFYGVINVHDKNVRTLFKTVSWLCDNYGTEGDIDDQYLGYLNNQGLLSNYWHDAQNLTTATMELSDYHWDSAKSTSTVITMGVTMFLNYIIQQVNDGYKVIHDIPDSDYRESRG